MTFTREERRELIEAEIADHRTEIRESQERIAHHETMIQVSETEIARLRAELADLKEPAP